MADCLSNLLKEVSGQGSTEVDLENIKPVIGADFEHIQLLDKKELEKLGGIFSIKGPDVGSFDKEDTDLQCVELDKEIQQTPEFPNNWCHLEDTDASEPFKMTITCSKLLLVFKDSASATHGTA